MRIGDRATAYRIPLLACVLLAFALRVLLLDSQSLWYDEGVTAAITQRGLGELTQWTANDIQPPLYYYVVAGWGRLGGWSEWSLRWPSAFFGVLAVPLLAMLALNLTRRRSAALLAALLTALHPLLVYYSQEARMYAMLVALGLLAGYLLVRAATAEPAGWRLWAGYVVAATAAVYTHYFAFFLLLGIGIAFLLESRARWNRQRIWCFVAANVAVLVLYVPWFAALFTRLRVDRSYWQGALKLNEALLAVAVSFTSGETVAERMAIWLLVVYGVISAWALVRLWHTRGQSRRLLIYGLLWLAAPTVAVLALALNVPKFNARYDIVALPGLLLLWAGGLSIDRRAVYARGLSIAAIMALVSGFFFADLNWFFNPAFTKDEWRQVAAFLRERIRPDEQVVLVSGHAWPVWEYYAPDMPALRLPDLPTLDVDAVLDFAGTGPALQAAFAEESGKRAAWLVNWQDEVVDPNDVTPVQLELGGREKGQSEAFYGLTLRRFSSLRPARFETAPPVVHVLDAHFGDQVILRGYNVLNNGDLLLFWQRSTGAAGTAADLHFALESTTVDGVPIAKPQDRRLSGYTYPFWRWPADAIVMGHIPAQAWLGESPQLGVVRFTVRVYDARDPASTPLVTTGGRDQLEVAPVQVIID